jgi:phosphatidylserine/phosphatidylglycerophosphate/cardiolipin synthase-like enzyme
LEGRHLDDFSKELISHAKSEVLIVNPFIQDCDLSNTLIDARKQGIYVQIVTRTPRDKNPEYLKNKQDYLSKLEKEGISVVCNEKVHAKLIVTDHAVAIVSSMNFYPDSSAGVSWEAGLVSTDTKVVDSTVRAIEKMKK